MIGWLQLTSILLLINQSIINRLVDKVSKKWKMFSTLDIVPLTHLYRKEQITHGSYIIYPEINHHPYTEIILGYLCQLVWDHLIKHNFV